MYVVIMGGGQVGSNLAKRMSEQGNEVLILENDQIQADLVGKKIGDDSVILGDACEVTIQEKAGMVRADIFFATTKKDEDNLIACQIAKGKFNVKRTISRVHNPDHEEIFLKMGVDNIVSDVDLMLEKIEGFLVKTAFKTLYVNEKTETSLIKIAIPSNSHCVDQLVKDVKLPDKAVLVGIYRAELPFIRPNVETFYMAGDQVIVSVKNSDIDALVDALTI